MKLLPRVLLLGVLSGFAAAQANADDVAASKAASARKPAKATMPSARTQDGLGVKFSNPYAPPEGTAQPKGPEFPAAQRATPPIRRVACRSALSGRRPAGRLTPFGTYAARPVRSPGRQFHGRLEARFLKQSRSPLPNRLHGSHRHQYRDLRGDRRHVAAPAPSLLSRATKIAPTRCRSASRSPLRNCWLSSVIRAWPTPC